LFSSSLSFHFDSRPGSFHAPWRREKESRHPATDNSLSNENEIKISFAYFSENSFPIWPIIALALVETALPVMNTAIKSRDAHVT
jgi:hypothetical protein